MSTSSPDRAPLWVRALGSSNAGARYGWYVGLAVALLFAWTAERPLLDIFGFPFWLAIVSSIVLFAVIVFTASLVGDAIYRKRHP